MPTKKLNCECLYRDKTYEIRRPHYGNFSVICTVTCIDCNDKLSSRKNFTNDNDLLEYTRSLIVCGWCYRD